jgi:hypothetical protein
MLKNKLGISEMLSYVLLIAIAVTISISVYSWIKYQVNISPSPDCKDETSIVLLEHSCGITGVSLNLKNNGRFNIDGIIFTVSNNATREPYLYLQKIGGSSTVPAGQYPFIPVLKPGDEKTIYFSNLLGDGNPLAKIEKIQIQPFMMSKRSRVMCKNAVIKETFNNCILQP